MRAGVGNKHAHEVAVQGGLAVAHSCKLIDSPPRVNTIAKCRDVGCEPVGRHVVPVVSMTNGSRCLLCVSVGDGNVTEYR